MGIEPTRFRGLQPQILLPEASLPIPRMEKGTLSDFSPSGRDIALRRWQWFPI